MVIQLLHDELEWRWTAERCSWATFFQTPDWFNAFLAGEANWSIQILKFSFPDGASAIFPFLSRRISWRRRMFLSGPAGVYGGWIAISPLPPHQQQQIINYLISNYDDIVWRMNPYAGLLLDHHPELRPDHTTVLDLKQGTDAIFHGLSKGHHAAVNQASRHGVLVRRASSLADWENYFNCYQNSLQRWGEAASSRYGWEIFSTLARLPQPDVSLWLAESQGRLLAGALCFSHHRHTVYWHGAAYRDAFPDRPVHLLISEIIRDAYNRGDDWFDFNPSGGHSGVERFKQGFGGQQFESPVLEVHKAGVRSRFWSVLQSQFRSPTLRRYLLKSQGSAHKK
jgi:hypothetical protein